MAGQIYNQDSGSDSNENSDVSEFGLTLAQFQEFHAEIKAQPSWRNEADKHADYIDGNQLDSDVIRRQQQIGLPPAIDNLMGPELDDLCGLEARLRKNWKVAPNSDTSDDEIAEALNARLNSAECHSKSDKACSDAFKGQAGVGVGWVEVSRNPNPFEFPYRAVSVPRNEVFWDWKGSHDPSGLDHRYLIRRRWTDKTQAKLAFPDKADLIEQASTGWSTFDNFSMDGGRSTGLQTGGNAIQFSGSGSPTMLGGATPGTYALLSTAYATEQMRGSTLEEQEWRDITNKRVCIFEVWYRVWKNALVFNTPNGKCVEVDQSNEMHMAVLASGQVECVQAVISKVHVSMWLGPHKLSDTPSPYKHNKFPYVPFWGKREDRTGVPYALARSWIYPQDTHNALNSKLRWGVSAARTTRTEGAYAGTDEQLHAEAARIDADIVLDANEMAKPGAVFKIERDFELNDQQLKLMEEARNSIKRSGGGLSQDDKQDDSNPVEQVPNMHGILFDNFRESRNEVGELLLSMIVEDLEGKSADVVIKGNVVNPDKTVTLNARSVHPQTGEVTITNDVSAKMLKVILEDVPSTPSYRGQQLQSFSEVTKAAPPEYQKVLFPHVIALMDVPDKDKVIAAIRDADRTPTPEQIKQQIDDAVQQALMKANIDGKTQELQLKKELQDAQIAKMTAETVLTRVTAMFEAMQSGGVVVSAPGVAPVGDAILQGAGYMPPTPAGINPEIEQVQQAQQPIPEGVQPQNVNMPAIHQNTHPGFPPDPMHADIGAKAGIEGG